MVLAEVTVYVLALQAIALLHHPCRASGDFLSPLLSPVLNGLCNAVYCGKGSCKVSENSSFGFSCQCNPGWTQFHIEDHLSFLPCLIPNCSINYSCSKVSAPPAPAPFPAPPHNFTLFDPCAWSFCGGGECVRSSTFEHSCECKKGYSNLLNVSSFPCYKDCSIGADCSNLGIGLSNSSSAPSSQPSLSDNGDSSAGDYHAMNILQWLVVFMTSLAMM
ncbi:slit homolog 2 protein [Phalaenopsis equestris]|uniref:slit homolog 2 protein n=1 Tax=Phalaenopsis equestris TaxID=78828 RepID=UPI0009E5F0C3|nr:slit homolog 2 protein [Phalaenopsis equestris]